jgi:hypothetical protein
LIDRWFAVAAVGMSSSSSSSSAATVFPPSPQLPPPLLVENLPPLHQLTPPVAAAAAPASEQLCYVHCHFCDTVLVVRDRIPALDLFPYMHTHTHGYMQMHARVV